MRLGLGMLGCCISLILVGSPLRAATDDYFAVLGADIHKLVAKEDLEGKEEWGKRLEMLLNEVKEQRNPSVKLGVGFSGDEAGANNLYKIAAEVDISRGIYPKRLAFKTGTDVTYKNSKLDEQVRSILVNYDYHVSPGLETYGFAERFTDTFMGIDDRYEIGGGAKLELEHYRLTGKGVELSQTFDALKDPTTFKTILALLGPSVEPQLTALQSDTDAIVATKKRHTRLAFGLAGTLMIELEDASVETYVDTLDASGSFVVGHGTSTIKVEVPSAVQLRAVARPSIVYRPTSELALEALVYFKLPLRDTHVDGRLDYRADGLARASLQVMPDRTGQEKVTLVWEVRENYDNTPPRIDNATIEETRAKGLQYRRTLNEKKHMSTSFKLQVNW